MGNANDTTIYAVIPRLLSCPKVMELLNYDLSAINSQCLKWHVRLYPKMAKSMVVSRSAPVLPVMVISLLVVLS